MESDVTTDLLNLTPGDHQTHYLWFTYDDGPDGTLLKEIEVVLQPKDGGNTVTVARMFLGHPLGWFLLSPYLELFLLCNTNKYFSFSLFSLVRFLFLRSWSSSGVSKVHSQR